MTSTAYYPTIKWYYYNATGAAWVDISGYVLTEQGVSGHWGMRSNKYTDRLAATGEMRMLLDNADGVFDPDDADALTGWGINTKIKLEITFDGTTWRRFYGTVQDIKFSDPNTKEHTSNVVVSDWMVYAYNYPLTDLAVDADKRGGHAVDAIADNIGQTPLSTNYSQGDYNFDALFDSVTVRTKAATELNKIVLSEFGYFYNRHDKINGETLTFEAQSDRNSARTVSQIPTTVAASSVIIDEDGFYILNEDGDNIIADETQDAHLNGFAGGYARTYGDNVINSVTITAYPKRTDSTEQTLYSLGSPIKLGPSEVKTINVKYQNLTTKESCNALTSLMIQPVATTDYLMNTNENGTGSNVTANLTVVADYKTAEGAITLTNTSENTGYVTKLKCRGYGVYQDSSVKTISEDTSSQLLYSTAELNFDQQYQRDVYAGETAGFKILDNNRTPRTRLESVSLIANKSDFNMLAFLSIDIGDMIKVTESSLNLDDYYYVQGIEFSIRAGDVISYKWILQEVAELAYSPIKIDFTCALGQMVSFGTTPAANLIRKTVMCRIDLDGFGDTGTLQFAIGKFQWAMYIGTASERLHYLDMSGNWCTANNTITAGTHSIAVSFDGSSRDNNPVLYIDGTSMAVTELVAPSTEKISDSGNFLMIGSQGSTNKSHDAREYDVKIYDRILTDIEVAAEVATPGSVTDGLVFNAPFVLTKRLPDYEDLTMTASDKVYDKIGGYLGTPYGSPIARLP